MSQRTTLAMTNRLARIAGGSRATAREFDDDHLIQEIKQADVFHSETPSNFERFQPVGMTAVPLKQTEEKGQQQQKQKQQKPAEDEGDWNHNQPKGPAAEVIMNYPNGHRAHPIAAMVDDRRVRPYGMKAGRGATYAPDGSEQMLYFKQDGAYLVSLDGKSVEKPDGKDKRQAFIGHVNKKMQTHKIDKNQQSQEEYKHEGDSINTGIRCTKDRIEFIANDKVFGYFEVSSQTWHFEGKIQTSNFDDKIEHSATNEITRKTKHDVTTADRIDHN